MDPADPVLGNEGFLERVKDQAQKADAMMFPSRVCRPCFSWSLTDGDGVEKAGDHAMRHAFAPILAAFKLLDDDGVEL